MHGTEISAKMLMRSIIGDVEVFDNTLSFQFFPKISGCLLGAKVRHSDLIPSFFASHGFCPVRIQALLSELLHLFFGILRFQVSGNLQGKRIRDGGPCRRDGFDAGLLVVAQVADRVDHQGADTRRQTKQQHHG